MSRIKDIIIIDTMNETENLSTEELINLAQTKNTQLTLDDELFEFMSDNQLFSVIAEKNLLILSNSLD